MLHHPRNRRRQRGEAAHPRPHARGVSVDVVFRADAVRRPQETHPRDRARGVAVDAPHTAWLHCLGERMRFPVLAFEARDDRFYSLGTLLVHARDRRCSRRHMLESMLVMIKTLDPAAALSETDRDALTGRQPVAEPRLVEVAGSTLADARAAVELGEGEVIAWIKP